MTIGNPARLAEFWEPLPIASASFSLGAAVVSTRTEGGDTITAQRGARLWRASVSLWRRRHREGEAIKARLAAMADAGQSFFAYPLPVFTTEYDPTGTLDTATIYTLPASGVEMRLSSLGTGYTLRGGDYLSFAYGANPPRYALHQVVSGTFVADAPGRTGTFEVRPAIRPGAKVMGQVRLYKPRMAAVIVPGSIQWGAAGRYWSDGISFEIIQTLRG